MTSTVEESLQEADTAWQEAGRAFEEAYGVLEQASSAEWDAGEERLRRYETAFKRGFIIERILDITSVTYHEGRRNVPVGLFEDYDEPAWAHLDQAHTESLEGKRATGVGFFRQAVGRYIERVAPKPQGQLKIHFNVKGDHRNERIGRRVYRSPQTSTEYIGELSAIQWRLPTVKETKKFGSTAAQAA